MASVPRAGAHFNQCHSLHWWHKGKKERMRKVRDKEKYRKEYSIQECVAMIAKIHLGSYLLFILLPKSYNIQCFGVAWTNTDDANQQNYSN